MLSLARRFLRRMGIGGRQIGALVARTCHAEVGVTDFESLVMVPWKAKAE